MSKKQSEPCEHIKEMWELCRINQVDFSGCDCSGFVSCSKCNVTVDNRG